MQDNSLSHINVLTGLRFLFFFKDPLGNIIAGLTVKRPKTKVIEKLMALDIVTDRKQLHKKRGGGGRKSGGGGRGRRTKNVWEEGANDELLPTDSSSDEEAQVEEEPSSGDSESEDDFGDEVPEFVKQVGKLVKKVNKKGNLTMKVNKNYTSYISTVTFSNQSLQYRGIYL